MDSGHIPTADALTAMVSSTVSLLSVSSGRQARMRWALLPSSAMQRCATSSVLRKQDKGE